MQDLCVVDGGGDAVRGDGDGKVEPVAGSGGRRGFVGAGWMLFAQSVEGPVGVGEVLDAAPVSGRSGVGESAVGGAEVDGLETVESGATWKAKPRA